MANLHLPATTRAKVTATENRKLSHVNRDGQITGWTEIPGLESDGQLREMLTSDWQSRGRRIDPLFFHRQETTLAIYMYDFYDDILRGD